MIKVNGKTFNDIIDINENKIYVYILTLNEENNIAECIKSVKCHTKKENIFVLDGGSSDRTLALSGKEGVNIIQLKDSSIAERRDFAIRNSNSRYVMFVDADQRLESEYILINLIEKYLSAQSVAGFQFNLNAITKSPSYWTSGFSVRHRLIMGHSGSRTVIGTPCIFDTEKIRNIAYNKEISGSSDDTEFCHKIISAGFHLKIIDEKANELVRSDFTTTIKKAFWYGMGDSELVRIVPVEKKINHTHHVFVRELILRPVYVLFSKDYSKFAFFALFGIARNLGFFYGLILKKDLASTKS